MEDQVIRLLFMETSMNSRRLCPPLNLCLPVSILDEEGGEVGSVGHDKGATVCYTANGGTNVFNIKDRKASQTRPTPSLTPQNTVSVPTPIST